jgi:hypothetical protein
VAEQRVHAVPAGRELDEQRLEVADVAAMPEYEEDAQGFGRRVQTARETPSRDASG